MTHIPLCQTKGCPRPNDPDWHRCFINGCNKQEGDHQHFPKKSLAGKGAKIVAFLCRNHHEKITLHQWREGVYTHPDGSKRYYVQNQKGEQQCERIIEAAPEDVQQNVPEIPIEARHTPHKRNVQENVLPAVKEEVAIGYGEVGLQLPDNLSREQWEGVMGTIQQMVVSVPWWVGDALVYGQRFGEEMWQAIKDRGGADYEKLRKYMWVAERVPIGMRIPELKWSHHRLVAGCESDKEREHWLIRAKDEELTVSEMNTLINGPSPAKEGQCPRCSYEGELKEFRKSDEA